jgi:hypothetical protein
MSMNAEQAREFLSDRLDALSSGRLQFTSTIRVELPDRETADVAIKVIDPRTFDRFSAIGVARYASGRVVGEQHTQMASYSFDWAKNHGHMSIMCQDFDMDPTGLFLPNGKEPHEPPTRHDDLKGLGAAVIWIDRLESCGTGYDLVYSEQTQRRAATMDTGRNGETNRLFIDPALQLALSQHIQ